MGSMSLSELVPFLNQDPDLDIDLELELDMQLNLDLELAEIGTEAGTGA